MTVPTVARIAARDDLYEQKFLQRYVYGREVNLTRFKTRWDRRWHIMGADGRCLPVCRQLHWAACGYSRKHQAVAARARTAGFDPETPAADA